MHTLVRQQFVFLFFILVFLTGCATVHDDHHMHVSKEMREAGHTNHATVYFIRPRPLKPKGVADKTIVVEYQDKKILTIDEGSHALVHIKASSGQIKVHSETTFTNQQTPIKVWRSRQFKFIEGKTYFIHLKRVDEEFRGIFYEAHPVKHDEAIVLAENTSASGEARGNPLDELAEISHPPESAFEKHPPVLPEHTYKPEPYLK